jgi:hypothetical protein
MLVYIVSCKYDLMIQCIILRLPLLQAALVKLSSAAVWGAAMALLSATGDGGEVAISHGDGLLRDGWEKMGEVREKRGVVCTYYF